MEIRNFKLINFNVNKDNLCTNIKISELTNYHGPGFPIPLPGKITFKNFEGQSSH